jgi:hypothetical protein
MTPGGYRESCILTLGGSLIVLAEGIATEYLRQFHEFIPRGRALEHLLVCPGAHDPLLLVTVQANDRPYHILRNLMAACQR